MKFIEALKKAFTTNLPLKLAAFGLAVLLIVIVNAA